MPSHPATSVAASPCVIETSTCAMSVSFPASRPASMQRRTRSTTNTLTALPAFASDGPGSKSAKGRENITSDRTGFSRTNVRRIG